jgi:malonyl-CoA/methylmalonyl-CoA synthetase
MTPLVPQRCRALAKISTLLAVNISFEVKAFDDLRGDEVYELLALRSAVFVVEQRCAYLDPDGKDARALHVLGRDVRGVLVAYARIFVGTEESHRIGRVIVASSHRGQDLGRTLMREALRALTRIDQERGASLAVALSAQAHLRAFYESLGFAAHSDVYEEDDIPHIAMIRTAIPVSPREVDARMDSLLPRLSLPLGTPALRVGDVEIDDRTLATLCAHHLERLDAHGASPGAVIATFTEPVLETLVALVAQLAGGYVTLPIDPKLGEAELAHVLRDASPELYVAKHPELFSERMLVPGMSIAMHAGARSVVPERPLLPTPALLLYTSGTTGLPKGAMISSTSLAACLDGLGEAWQWTSNDTIVHALPVFHVHGLVIGLLGALRRGGMLHWVPRFQVESIAHAIHAVAPPRTAMFFGVPTMLHRLGVAAETNPDVRDAIAAARVVVSGSAGLPLKDHERIFELTGKRVVERYGMTETLITLAVRADDPQPGLVGVPIRGVEAKLVDETRQPIEAFDGEQMGEIAVRGPTLFLGYLNRAEATREVMDDAGWFYTGDLATRDARGAFRIVGRRSTDLIKCGGFKVGAGEVEGALLEHADVREAAVLGAPDPDLGERIVAFVVLREGALAGDVLLRSLEDHVAAWLSPHKRPRTIRFLDALPRNAMGKVQKKVLKMILEGEHEPA